MEPKWFANTKKAQLQPMYTTKKDIANLVAHGHTQYSQTMGHVMHHSIRGKLPHKNKVATSEQKIPTAKETHTFKSPLHKNSTDFVLNEFVAPPVNVEPVEKVYTYEPHAKNSGPAGGISLADYNDPLASLGCTVRYKKEKKQQIHQKKLTSELSTVDKRKA